MRYRKSALWSGLAPNTQRLYLQGIKKIEAWSGDLPCEAVSRKAVKTWQEVMEAAAPTAAANTLRTLRIVLNYGKDLGYRIDDLNRLHLRSSGGGDAEAWSDHEVSAYMDQAKLMGRPSMALAAALALGLGQREGDVIALSRASYNAREGTISIVQHKTGRRLEIPALPELKHEIDTAPKNGVLFVISEKTRQPYKEPAFRKLHRKICDAAGIPTKRKFMHLRHSCATRLGDAGCSEELIRSITGHKSGAVRRYVRPSAAAPRAAIEKLLEHRNRRATQDR